MLMLMEMAIPLVLQLRFVTEQIFRQDSEQRHWELIATTTTILNGGVHCFMLMLMEMAIPLVLQFQFVTEQIFRQDIEQHHREQIATTTIKPNGGVRCF